jgi:hypothetical protein
MHQPQQARSGGPRPAPMAALPGPLQPLWALAVAITEDAAELAASRAVGSWRASAYLYAAADGAWGRTAPVALGAGAPTAAARAGSSAWPCCSPRPPPPGSSRATAT